MTRNLMAASWSLFAAAILLALTSCSPFGEGPTEIDQDTDDIGVAVETEIADQTGIREAIYLTGEIEPTRTVEVFPDQAGELTELRIEIGDRVGRNQEIARIDPSRPGQRFASSAVRSSISGTVVAINSRVGSDVSQQQPIARIATTEDLEITTFVPERRIGTLSIGQSANVRLAPYPDDPFSARVTRIAPVLDSGSRALETTMRFDTPDARIRPGMFARIDLIVEERPEAITVPQRSVLRRDNAIYLYVANDEGRAERREVTLGIESAGRVEVREGLQPGERVITRGQNLIQEGTAVNEVVLPRESAR